MKNNIYFALSMALNSCDDKDITFAPYNAVSESIVLRNAADFENALTGAYMIKKWWSWRRVRICDRYRSNDR
jgi:hypothetical protein